MAHQPPPGFAVTPTMNGNATKTKAGTKKILDQAVGCMRWLGRTPWLKDSATSVISLANNSSHL
jgi:hypothetical protein